MAMLNNQRVYETYMPKDALEIYIYIHVYGIWHGYGITFSSFQLWCQTQVSGCSRSRLPSGHCGAAAAHQSIWGVYFMEIPIENG